MKNHGNKETILELTNTARAIADCSSEIQKYANIIMLSCQKTGAKGNEHKDMLLAKIDDLEKLAELYDSASRKLMNAASNLARGVPNDEIMNNLLVYSAFFVDQVKCEGESLRHVVGMLRKGPYL